MGRYTKLQTNKDTILKKCEETLKTGKRLISESPRKEKIPPTKNEQFVLDSWNGLKNKTKVFETIPIVYALYKHDDLSASEIIDVLRQPYDWDEAGKLWIFNVLKKIGNDEKAYETFLKVVINAIMSPNGPSLKELNGNKTIDDFIHGSITKFYTTLKKYSPHNDGSKTFTADVVILWGTSSASNVINGNLLQKIQPTEESLCLLSDNKTLMACVSLKALEGRVGKVTTLFQDRFGIKSTSNESYKPEIKEGVFDLLNKASSSVIKTVKSWATKFTEWVTKTLTAIKDIFSPTNQSVVNAQKENDDQVKEAEKVLAMFDRELEEHFRLNGKILTESADDEPLQISSCFRNQMLSWYEKLENDTKKINTAFIEFQKNTSEYATKNLFRLSFTSLDEKNREFQTEIKRIKSVIDKIKRAKEQPAATKRVSCLLLVDSNKPLTYTRKELKNILMSNSNYISISLLNSMIDEFLKKSKSLKTSDAIGNLIKFSTELNAEAIFGAATDVPLIKYDGTKIIRFGSRKNYEENHKSKMIDHFKSIETLPIIGLKIYPPKSKETVTYYVVLLYTLADYKGAESNIPMDGDFVYNVISFKCNSGSDFAFAIESDTTTTGDKLVKSMSSDIEVTL
jgi:hypothetical protein